MNILHTYILRYRLLFYITAVSTLIIPGETFSQTALSSIPLTWTATGDDGSSGSATAYDIRYSTSIITDANWDAATRASNEPIPQSAGSTEIFIIDSLEPNTTYYFAIKTSDEAFNWSALSNVISKTTLDTTPPGRITDLLASTDTANGAIVLGWTAPGDDNMVGTAALYEIRYSLNTITDLNWLGTSLFTAPPLPLAAGEQQSIKITGLTAGLRYYIAIKTFDSNGNQSALSNVSSAEAGINISTDLDDSNNNLPKEFSLAQNYPNPFNPTTTIGFSLPKTSYVKLNIYNIEGKKVKSLVDNSLPAGQHLITWDGTNSDGSKTATGIYIYRIVTDTYTAANKMVLLK